MKSAIKKLSSMALAMMSMRLSQTLKTFLIMVMLAQLGHVVLAASFTIAMIRTAILLMFMSPLLALGSITGRQLSEGKTAYYPAFLCQSWLFAILLSVPAIIILHFIKPILIACHQPRAVIPYVVTFMTYFKWALPAIYISTVNLQFLAGNKRQRFVMVFTLVSLSLQVTLAYALIFGKFGLPKLGVAGAGLANLIGYPSLLISTFYVLKVTKASWKQPLFKGFTWLKLSLKIGMPIFARTTSNMVLMLVLTMLTGLFGVVSMAASQIANEYMLFVVVPMFGISEASAIVISHAAGEKDIKEIKNLAHLTSLIALGLSTFVGLLFLLFHHQLAGFFINFNAANAEAIYKLAMILLLIRIITMFFDSVSIGLAGSLQGLFDTKSSMLVSLISSWCVGLPLALLLGVYFQLGVIGIITGVCVAKIVSFFALWFRWRFKLKRLSYQLAQQA